ncbi:MAG: hypothetical protein JSS72_12775 [Armatimonadetes bacterium]|nr:hypothetical protein [Armatimonadota bacterium]
MSQVIEGIDVRGHLIGWAKGVTGMFIKDINALPEDKITATMGGCTRPVSELTADAMGLVLWVTAAFKGQTLAGSEEEQMAALTAKLATKSAIVQHLGSAVDDFCAAIASANDETLAKVVTTPWGMESSLYSLAHTAVSHIWYHDGQLNYIQTLLGDGKVHWMEE